VSESAVSAKRGWGSFGAKPAQSETPARAAAKRRPTRADEVGQIAELGTKREQRGGESGERLIGVSGGSDGEERSTQFARNDMRKRGESCCSCGLTVGHQLVRGD
jgi:hypothetical protein